MYVYIYICIFIYIYVYTYIYVYIYNHCCGEPRRSSHSKSQEESWGLGAVNLWLQSGEADSSPLSCRSLSTKETCNTLQHTATQHRLAKQTHRPHLTPQKSHWLLGSFCEKWPARWRGRACFNVTHCNTHTHFNTLKDESDEAALMWQTATHTLNTHSETHTHTTTHWKTSFPIPQLIVMIYLILVRGSYWSPNHVPKKSRHSPKGIMNPSVSQFQCVPMESQDDEDRGALYLELGLSRDPLLQEASRESLETPQGVFRECQESHEESPRSLSLASSTCAATCSIMVHT